MSIAILHPRLTERGGAERKILILYEALKARGEKVEFLTQDLDAASTFAHMVDARIRVVPPRFPKLIEFFRMARRLADYDFVVASNSPAHIPAVISKLLRRKKIVWICNEVAVLLNRRESLFWRAYYAIERRLVRCIDDVIVNSRSTQRYFEGYYRHPARIVYSGLDFDLLHSLDMAEAPPIAEDRPFVFILSRMEAHKNIRFLSRLAPFMAQRHPDLRLIIAGTGSEREWVETFAKTHDSCLYVGPLSEAQKVAYLKKARLFAFLPEDEPLGVTMMEALYFGTPVVAFNQGGPTEIIRFPWLGTLCDNEGAYLEAVSAWISTPPDADGKLAMRDYIVAHFSKESMVDGFIREILTPKGTGYERSY